MKDFDSLPEFENEFRRLFRKCRTLEDDLKKFKQVLLSYPTGVGKNFVIIHSTEILEIVKMRMACRALCDRSLRIVYAYFKQEQRIEFIEIYYKGDKENEDRDRIREYLSRY